MGTQGEQNNSSTILMHALMQRGMRSTAPRRRLAETISSVHDTFTAEDICAQLPDVGRATVYRTLRLLLDAGAICKVVMPNGEMAYSTSEAMPEDAGEDDRYGHHHHIVCAECNSVRVFSSDSIEQAVEQLSKTNQLGTVVGHRIEVYDVCPKCISVATD